MGVKKSKKKYDDYIELLDLNIYMYMAYIRAAQKVKYFTEKSTDSFYGCILGWSHNSSRFVGNIGQSREIDLRNGKICIKMENVRWESIKYLSIRRRE